MNRAFTLLVGLLLSTALFAQREEFNRAIINDDRDAIIKYGEMLAANGEQSKALFRKLALTYKDKSSYGKDTVQKSVSIKKGFQQLLVLSCHKKPIYNC